MKLKAITQVWNHEKGELVKPGESFEMSTEAGKSLIEIKAAEEDKSK